MNIPNCSSCASSVDVNDNFCRHCGVSVSAVRVPAVRQTSDATIWQPAVSPVVKGAAVMAAGTVGQFLFRRVVSSLLTGGNRRQRASRGLRVRRGGDDGMVDEQQIITETVMMRRVRVRRQA